MTRSQNDGDSLLRLGNITLDRSTFELSSPTGSFRLANKEFQMLELLMCNPRHLISTERFPEKIWGYDAKAEVSVVWVYISFVATAMLAVFIVLASMLGLINFLNYRNIINSTDEILELLAVNEGTFPKEFDSDNIGNGFLGFSSPEIPYESRYFSVQLDPDGVLLLVDIDQIAAIDEDTAVSYAQEAMGSPNDRGFISTYQYLKRSSQDGTSIIFLGCGRNLSTLRAFFLLSILGGLGGFLLTFLVVLLLSGRILKPVAESYSRQKRFITDAGHEIKTPLTIIGADTTLLEMEWGENEWLTDIQKQITRLTELTNELIYLSKMEEDRQIPMIVFPLSDRRFHAGGTISSDYGISACRCFPNERRYFMSPEEFYGKAYPQLRLAQEHLLALISSYPEKEDAVSGIRQIESCCSRIKSPESMAGKLRRMGLSPTAYNALTQVHDALGLRVICSFTDDIYRVARWLEKQEELEVIKIKDYLAFPKPNGYRSYHMIIKVKEGPERE